MLNQWTLVETLKEKNQVLQAHGFNQNGLNPLWFHPVQLFADHYLAPDLMHACKNLTKHLIAPCLHLHSSANSKELKFSGRVISLVSERINICCLPHDSDCLPDFVTYDAKIPAAQQKQVLVQFAPVMFLHDFETDEDLLYYSGLCSLAWALSIVLSHGNIDRSVLKNAEMTLYRVFVVVSGNFN